MKNSLFQSWYRVRTVATATLVFRSKLHLTRGRDHLSRGFKRSKEGKCGMVCWRAGNKMLLEIVILTYCSRTDARAWAFTILSDNKYVIMCLGCLLKLVMSYYRPLASL